MYLTRRSFLWGLAVTALGTWWAAAQAALDTLVRPWSKRAFAAEGLDEALQQLYGAHKREASDRIHIEIPDVAEDGAVVPVSVSADLPHVESIVLLAEKNPAPLIAEFILGPEVEAYASTRVKLNADGAVLAVVKSQDRYYEARKQVKVGISGCT